MIKTWLCADKEGFYTPWPSPDNVRVKVRLNHIFSRIEGLHFEGPLSLADAHKFADWLRTQTGEAIR